MSFFAIKQAVFSLVIAFLILYIYLSVEIVFVAVLR